MHRSLHIPPIVIISRDKEDLNLQRIQSLTRSLHFLGQVDGVVLVFSGDLAKYGKREEYQLVSAFLDCLTESIRNAYELDNKDFKILVVPGNHDIDWGNSRQINPDSIRGLSNIVFRRFFFMARLRTDDAVRSRFFPFCGQALSLLTSSKIKYIIPEANRS